MRNSIEIPNWINQDISPSDIAAINQGGCDSGAYMPAVEYYTAKKVMNEYGDEILDFLQSVSGDLPEHADDISWDGLACFYLSRAVELWAAINEDLEDWENEEPLAA